MATHAEDWRPIIGVDAATPGFPAAGTLDDEHVVVWRTAAGFRATARACPHQYVDLLGGRVVDDGTAVRCPVHGFVYKLADGDGVNCPGFRLQVYEVIERDGTLFARAAA